MLKMRMSLEMRGSLRKEEEGSCAMEDLEEALPVRRGLSRFYNGKSRSFANLADAFKIKDIGQTGLFPHLLQDEETAQKHARAQGRWGRHIKEAHDLRHQFGFGYEQLGERMQLSMQLNCVEKL
ncbi:hypothetical protein SASPL_148913 [Salvia splendens]|uniref:Uncharacterized protein n=2 Tax=Salvia splendens TaxID=180675 RepID=A0A8X8WAS7_SALSN|nr:hypothetical protein SASPL_148913 [Salvia splendens]